MHKIKQVLIFATMLAALTVSPGCKTTLEPGGAYTDPALLNADQTIIQAKQTLGIFVKWEYDNRALLADMPGVKAAANTIRANARAWISSALATRDAYAANPTPDNKATLQTILATLTTAAAEASKYMGALLPQK